MTYNTPVNAIDYLLHHVVDLDEIKACPAYVDVNDDLISDILQGAAVFSKEVLAPTNWSGDQNHPELKGGNVIASPGFKQAYRSFVEAGWLGLAGPTEYGGMGLPQVLSVGVNEMLYSANMALGLCPMLTSSASNAILAHASDELKATYLEKMINGEWSGAMDLTEPQAGSDLGELRAKAVPNGDGTYALSGQKIYITWGDHDCADNIIHLVLARLPDAPAGSRGISLFLAPKYFVEPDGSLGKRNNFRPIGLEDKLGIHGSPTCVMEFDNATGWLVGPENKGLACMFTMMNEARLFVGVQGVAIGERAYQAALSYANDRVQGKVAGEAEKAPIIGHPDVRRMLMEMKAGLMGARAICMATAAAGDIAVSAEDEETRNSAHAREALLTPLAKAYGSDIGVEMASIGVQVHGGMGFVEETGAAQHYRDSRIAPIYEGTNGIQAIDLVGRKLRRDGGEAMQALIAELRDILAQVTELDDQAALELGSAVDNLGAGLEAMTTATNLILTADETDALASATAYLALCSDVVSGAFLIKGVVNGLKKQDPRAKSMQKLVWFHSVAFLSRAPSYLDQIKYGAGPVFGFDKELLADL
ncbi:MAG: acyl-CoA dehydrogenase [Hyphomonadaceae bacterium]|nr:acyl-CoA dehydrogenase [Hyphomonadaceae bacterium]